MKYKRGVFKAILSRFVDMFVYIGYLLILICLFLVTNIDNIYPSFELNNIWIYLLLILFPMACFLIFGVAILKKGFINRIITFINYHRYNPISVVPNKSSSKGITINDENGLIHMEAVGNTIFVAKGDSSSFGGIALIGLGFLFNWVFSPIFIAIDLIEIVLMLFGCKRIANYVNAIDDKYEDEGEPSFKKFIIWSIIPSLLSFLGLYCSFNILNNISTHQGKFNYGVGYKIELSNIERYDWNNPGEEKYIYYYYFTLVDLDDKDETLILNMTWSLDNYKEEFGLQLDDRYDYSSTRHFCIYSNDANLASRSVNVIWEVKELKSQALTFGGYKYSFEYIPEEMIWNNTSEKNIFKKYFDRIFKQYETQIFTIEDCESSYKIEVKY